MKQHELEKVGTHIHAKGYVLPAYWVLYVPYTSVPSAAFRVVYSLRAIDFERKTFVFTLENTKHFAKMFQKYKEHLPDISLRWILPASRIYEYWQIHRSFMPFIIDEASTDGLLSLLETMLGEEIHAII